MVIPPAPDGLGISARGVTVSTVGLVPRINQLADEGIPVTLARVAGLVLVTVGAALTLKR